MLTVNYDLNMDLSRLEFPQLIKMHDGGNGMHHILRLHLFEDGKAWTPPDDCTWTLSWRKLDGGAGTAELEVTTYRHIVSFEIPRAAIVGRLEVSALLRLTKHNHLLGTFIFRLCTCQHT